VVEASELLSGLPVMAYGSNYNWSTDLSDSSETLAVMYGDGSIKIKQKTHSILKDVVSMHHRNQVNILVFFATFSFMQL
ncbi:hypothetical protein ACJX0J_027252, partial [Zea mays]